MADPDGLELPLSLPEIEVATRASGFGMASDRLTGSLLRTLAASKPGGGFLELGTGTGLATAWLLSGMDAASRLLTVDNDPRVVAIAERHLGGDPRVAFHVMEGGAFLEALCTQGLAFDLIFADTWPGKYTHLDEALKLLKVGGIYIVDDMLPQPNWPEDHPPKVAHLISLLEGRSDLRVTRLDWSTGLIVGARTR